MKGILEVKLVSIDNTRTILNSPSAARSMDCADGIRAWARLPKTCTRLWNMPLPSVQDDLVFLLESRIGRASKGRDAHAKRETVPSSVQSIRL